MNENQKQFDRYVECQARMRFCRRMRRQSGGIAYAKDYHARLWQKYNALSKRQYAAIMKALTNLSG